MAKSYIASVRFPAILVMTAASLLTACSQSVQFDKRPVIELRNVQPPAPLSQPCYDPVNIPKGAALAPLWAEDRANLARCRDEHAGLLGWISRLHRGLAGP